MNDQSVNAISRARPPPDSGGRPMITTTTDHVEHREPTATIATMPRILIVEDNPDLAYGLRTGLEIEGYEAEIAHDGERGLDRARSWQPDLVILDLMLPGMDGYRVLKAL